MSFIVITDIRYEINRRVAQQPLWKTKVSHTVNSEIGERPSPVRVLYTMERKHASWLGVAIPRRGLSSNVSFPSLIYAQVYISYHLDEISPQARDHAIVRPGHP